MESSTEKWDEDEEKKKKREKKTAKSCRSWNTKAAGGRLFFLNLLYFIHFGLKVKSQSHMLIVNNLKLDKWQNMKRFKSIKRFTSSQGDPFPRPLPIHNFSFMREAPTTEALSVFQHRSTTTPFILATLTPLRPIPLYGCSLIWAHLQLMLGWLSPLPSPKVSASVIRNSSPPSLRTACHFKLRHREKC